MTGVQTCALPICSLQLKDSQVIHIIDLSRAKRAGKRGQAISALAQGMTVSEFKRMLDTTTGLKGYAGWALKTALDEGAIRLE